MKYLSINGVINKFGISRSTLRRWTRDLDFPKPYTVGERKLFFLESEVDQWAKEKMVRAA